MSSLSSISLVAMDVRVPPKLLPQIHDAALRSGLTVTMQREVWPQTLLQKLSVTKSTPGGPEDLDLAATRALMTKAYKRGEVELGTISEAVMLPFIDASDQHGYKRFYVPTDLWLNTPVRFAANETGDTLPGSELALSGNDYFKPWTMTEITAVIRESPILQDFAGRMNRLVQVPPWTPPANLTGYLKEWSTWQAGEAGWFWVAYWQG